MVFILLALSATLAVAATNDVTSIKNEHFALKLPGNWSATPRDDPGLWQYSNESQNEAISVTVLKPMQASTVDQRRARLNEFLSVRLKTERDTAPLAQIESQPKIETQRDNIVASYIGYEPDTGRRFAALTIVSATHLVCFYLETFGLTEADFMKREKSLLGAVQVAD